MLGHVWVCYVGELLRFVVALFGLGRSACAAVQFCRTAGGWRDHAVRELTGPPLASLGSCKVVCMHAAAGEAVQALCTALSCACICCPVSSPPPALGSVFHLKPYEHRSSALCGDEAGLSCGVACIGVLPALFLILLDAAPAILCCLP